MRHRGDRVTLLAVTLHRADGQAVLEIADDGRGFDPERIPAGQGRCW